MRIIILFMFIMLTTPALAQERDVDIFDLNEVFDLSIHLSDETGDITGAECNTEIRDDNFSVIKVIAHNEIDGGWYNATYSSNESGTFPCRHNCTKGTDFTSETCDFKIRTNEKMIITAIIVILALALIFLIIGIWKQDFNFGFLSGFLFVIIGIYIFTTGLPSFDNFVSNSLAIILMGLGAYILFRASVDSLNEAERGE